MRIELIDRLGPIANVSPNMTEGSENQKISQINLRNIRTLLDQELAEFEAAQVGKRPSVDLPVAA